MEKIYHRKRSKNHDEENSITGNMYLKKQEQSSYDGPQSPESAKQHLPTPDCILHRNLPETSLDMEVGSVYEIDHTTLPPESLVQLRSTRVVMVAEKTDLNVTVRFPSLQSLGRYVNNSIRDMYPVLDEKFIMRTKLAFQVLFRRVGAQEFAENKHLEKFWMLNSPSLSGFGDVFSNKGKCLSELQCNGMVQWGVRRQVKFIGKHRENHLQPASSFTGGEKKAKEPEGGEEDGEDDEGEEDEEREDGADAVTEEANEIREHPKRKRGRSKLFPFPKKAKRENRRQNKTKDNCEQIVLRNPKQCRWSAERYKQAEENLLAVMKAKGATFGNPILRPALRAEARKQIGDTGLLDHLLKHIAGKVAPGGAERFRRRHNAEGAMEYWLEDADLADIRRDAGVQDPYWCPPPGWNPGDCPTQDPICARELKQLKEQISKIERAMEDVVIKKQLEEEIVKLRGQMKEMQSNSNWQQGSQVNVASNPFASSQKLDLDGTMVSLEKYKEQLTVISDFLSGMDGHIRKLTSKVEEEGTSRLDPAVLVSTESCAEKERKEFREEKGRAAPVQKAEEERGLAGEHRKECSGKAADEKTAAEEKAAKIRRPKSGFRMCKPQGTFLWPNMVRSNMLSPKVVVQVEDLFVVPTPPSVSSTTAPPQLPYHHPVKPLPEKRAVKVTVSTVSKGPSCELADKSFSTTSTAAAVTNNSAPLINLNDFPFANNPGDAYCGTPTSIQTVTARAGMPTLVKREGNPWGLSDDGSTGSEGSAMDLAMMGHGEQRECFSSSRVSTEVGSWLALTTPNTTAEEP